MYLNLFSRTLQGLKGPPGPNGTLGPIGQTGQTGIPVSSYVHMKLLFTALSQLLCDTGRGRGNISRSAALWNCLDIVHTIVPQLEPALEYKPPSIRSCTNVLSKINQTRPRIQAAALIMAAKFQLSHSITHS